MAASSTFDPKEEHWTLVEPNDSVKSSIKKDLASSIQELFPSFDPILDEAQVYTYTHIARYYNQPPAHSAVQCTADHFKTPGSSDHFRHPALMLLHVKPAAVGYPGTFVTGMPTRDTVIFIHKGARGGLDHHYTSGLHGDSKFYCEDGVNHPHIINFNWQGKSGPKRLVKFILVDRPYKYIGVFPEKNYQAWFYAQRCTASELSHTFWQEMASKRPLPTTISDVHLGEMD